MAILPLGYSKPLFTMARLTLRLASLTAVSPIPVMSKYGSPLLISVCISVSDPSGHARATVIILENMAVTL